MEDFPKQHGIKGSLQIFFCSSPASFSCMIIDDDVFFFPFLAGPESNNDPIIQCIATQRIGKAIIEHVKLLLADSTVCECVKKYEKGPAPPAAAGVAEKAQSPSQQ